MRLSVSKRSVLLTSIILKLAANYAAVTMPQSLHGNQSKLINNMVHTNYGTLFITELLMQPLEYQTCILYLIPYLISNRMTMATQHALLPVCQIYPTTMGKILTSEKYYHNVFIKYVLN